MSYIYIYIVVYVYVYIYIYIYMHSIMICVSYYMLHRRLERDADAGDRRRDLLDLGEREVSDYAKMNVT